MTPLLPFTIACSCYNHKGYGSTSTFGGPIPTPTFDAIAKRGLRYTAFHTTALCSPTRAALLTGRNHHAVHTGKEDECINYSLKEAGMNDN